MSLGYGTASLARPAAPARTNVVQWSVDQFWGQLRALERGIRRVRADLEANRLDLMALWTRTKAERNRVRAADHQKLLTPLIHRNSELRLMVRDLESKFTRAAALASGALKQAGLTTPALSGLGFVVGLAPAAAVALVVLALTALAAVVVMTQAQRANTAIVAGIMGDSSTTPEQKLRLLKALEDENKAAPRAFDFGQIAPILGLVALIMLGPPLLSAFGSRRATA